MVNQYVRYIIRRIRPIYIHRGRPWFLIYSGGILNRVNGIWTLKLGLLCV